MFVGSILLPEVIWSRKMFQTENEALLAYSKIQALLKDGFDEHDVSLTVRFLTILNWLIGIVG